MVEGPEHIVRGDQISGRHVHDCKKRQGEMGCSAFSRPEKCPRPEVSGDLPNAIMPASRNQKYMIVARRHIYNVCHSICTLQLLLLLLRRGPLNLKRLFPACGVVCTNRRFSTDSFECIIEGPLHGFFDRLVKDEWKCRDRRQTELKDTLVNKSSLRVVTKVLLQWVPRF